MTDTPHLARLVDTVEDAARELVDAAVDATDAGHEHGDSSPQARDAYKHYVNWQEIVRDACNTLRTAMGLPERRPDVEAYIVPEEPEPVCDYRDRQGRMRDADGELLDMGDEAR